MSYDKELIAGKLRRWEKYLERFWLPEWKELPDLGLYICLLYTSPSPRDS